MSLLWPGIRLAKSSGACHFFMLGSSLWMAPWFFLMWTPRRPQSLAVNSLVTRTLWARMFPCRTFLLWRNSLCERRGGVGRGKSINFNIAYYIYWYWQVNQSMVEHGHWDYQQCVWFINILTSAEATCWAMVIIRLSFISHGGFTLSLQK